MQLFGGGLDRFSQMSEMNWYVKNAGRRLLSPGLLMNAIAQNIEFALKRAKLTSYPFIIQLEETNLCNLDCPMCSRLFQKRSYGEMNLENAKHIIDQFPYLLWASLGGWGEPLICKDLFNIIRYCNSKSIGCGFITNGTLLTPQVIDNITKMDFLRIGISIDSASPKKIRNYQNFNKMDESIKHLNASLRSNKRNAPRFVVTLMNENLDDLESIIILANEVGIEHVHIHGLTAYDNAANYRYDPSEISPRLLNVVNFAKSLNVKVTHTDIFGKPSNNSCRFPWSSCFISWDGNVSPCCKYTERIFGNIFETEFKQIWNNPGYQAFRMNMALGKFDDICMNRCGLSRWM